MAPLDALQRAHYDEQGYLILRGLVDHESLARYDARFCDLIEGRVPEPKGFLVVRDVMVAKGAVEPASELHAVNKVHGFEEDAVLFAYSEDPRIVECVDALVGPGVMTIATNVINKPPGVDGRHPLHQDLLYFPLRPPERMLGVCTAIAPMTRENGCLAVVPGSHRAGLREHAEPDWDWVNAFFFGVELDESELAARVHLEMRPGDTLFFHPLLLHGSGHNETDDFRRAITTHYAWTGCEKVAGHGPRVSTFRKLSLRS